MKAFGRISNRQKTVIFSLLIFSIALAVRFFIWQDTRLDVWKVQTGLIEASQLYAKFIVEDGIFSFFDSQARLASVDFIGHPPGYSIVWALITAVAGESDAAIQSFSILIDALSAVVIFLIAQKLFSGKTALLAGLFIAFSPQFALNTVFLLPDALCIFPILLAVYFLVSASKMPRVLTVVCSGICLGLSCWLRSNSFLLPLFFVAAIWLLFEGKKRLILSAALLAAFVLTVAPITVRNAILYREFIPISLGAGQTLLEGIGEYDTENKFGIPASDYAVCKTEAERFNKPEYELTLFGKDGVWRDRMRLKMGWDFIKEHPFWFAKIMVQRAFWMLKLEKAEKVSPEVSAARIPSDNELPNPFWEKKGLQLIENGLLVSPNASFTNTNDNSGIILQTDDTKYNAQYAVETDLLKKDEEYLTDVTLQLKKGRISIKIVGADSGRTYFSIVETLDWRNAEKPMQTLKLYYVPARDEKIKIVVSNETPNPPTSLVEIREIKTFDLGESSFGWTRFFRWLVSVIQKIFTTNMMLPLAIIGLIILIRQRKWSIPVILLTVPLYNFFVQSALHTEYRYILVIHYFLFVLAAFAVVSSSEFLLRRAKLFFEKSYFAKKS